MENEIIKKVIAEIQNPKFESTKQYLEIHDVIYLYEKLNIARIDLESEGSAVAYLPIKDEKFHLAVYFNTDPILEIRHIGTEPYNSVYLIATSDTLSLNQMASLTILPYKTGWSKGDGNKIGLGVHRNSAIQFEPNPEPDELEDKLIKMMDFLEGDEEGVRKLIAKGDAVIRVVMEFHNGNNMLGGISLHKEIIARLSALQLTIDFDLYTGGNLFLED